jgi:hypothetical protein
VDDDADPPEVDVWLTLDEALDLLADLEDARDALTHGDQLVVAINVENQRATQQ